MHIVYTIDIFFTEGKFGGPAHFLNNISTIFGRHGHQVSIIVISNKLDTIQWNKNVTVHRAVPTKGRFIHEALKNSRDKEKNRIGWILEGSYSLYEKLEEINRKTPVDIVDGRCYGFSFYRNKKIPLVTRVSCLYPEGRLAGNSEFKPEVKKKDWLLSEKFGLYSLRKADAVYTPSINVSTKLADRLHRKVQVIESPFNFEGNSFDDSLYRKEYQGKKYLLFYGTLGYLKGVHNIAAIIFEFLDRYKDFYFLFAGDDTGAIKDGKKIPMIDYVRMKAGRYAGRVLYSPFIKKKEQLYSLVSHSLACVFPSRMDNFPNACIESMALGKIVVGTKGASFEQLITDRENGLLAERDSPESLMKAIDDLMSLPEEKRRQMEDRAKKTVERLEPDTVYGNLLSFYEDVIAIKKYRRS